MKYWGYKIESILCVNNSTSINIFGAFTVLADSLYTLQKNYDNLEYRYDTLKDELKHARANARYEYNRGWRDAYRR